MDFGLILIIRNPPKWRRPDHEVYQSYVDNAVLGEKLGFSHIWTSEHHFMECGWSPSQFPILATIAARTERIRVGTLIYLLALHNPVQAAEDAATMAAPVRWTPPVLATDQYESSPTLSPDGHELFFFRATVSSTITACCIRAARTDAGRRRKSPHSPRRRACSTRWSSAPA